MIAGKVWGTTEDLLRTPWLEIHRLTILPNSECSLHKHDKKWNGFYVESGVLYIDVEKRDYKLTDTTPLGARELTTVKPGEVHRFRTGNEGAMAIEFYYPEPMTPLAEDIIRYNVGATATKTTGL